jgi:hypothetical protein
MTSKVVTIGQARAEDELRRLLKSFGLSDRVTEAAIVMRRKNPIEESRANTARSFAT